MVFHWLPWPPSTGHQPTATAHQAPCTKHHTQSAGQRATGTEQVTPNVRHRAQCTVHRGTGKRPPTLRPNTKHHYATGTAQRAPSGDTIAGGNTIAFPPKPGLTLDLNEEIRNYKGKGNKGYGKGAKSTKSQGQQGKRSFDEMTLDEQWWLEQLWKGSLHRKKEAAASKCQRVEAPRFTIHS